MTRKDYVLIAKTIANLDEIVDEFTIEVIAEAFAVALEKTNPRFDYKRFFGACKLSDNKIKEIQASLRSL
jgi:hypothetical protein